MRPGRKQPAEVDQGITDSDQFPIHDRRQVRAVIPVHYVREMEIAVHDAWPENGRSIFLQPDLDVLDIRQRVPAGPSRVRSIGLQLRFPSDRLALQKIIRSTEIGQPQSREIKGAQRRDGLDQRESRCDGARTAIRRGGEEGRLTD